MAETAPDALAVAMSEVPAESSWPSGVSVAEATFPGCEVAASPDDDAAAPAAAVID